MSSGSIIVTVSEYFEENLIVYFMSQSGLEIGRIIEVETPFGSGTFKSFRDKKEFRVDNNRVTTHICLNPFFLQIDEHAHYENKLYVFVAITYNALSGYKFTFRDTNLLVRVLSLGEVQRDLVLE